MRNHRLHRLKKLITQIFLVSCALCFISSMIGCGPQWKKKFVRKRAPRKPEPVFVYEPKEYARGPCDEIYKRHFLFWKSWQEELINKLGLNRTSDVRNFEEALKSLSQMKSCLKEEKALELEGYIKIIESLRDVYKSKDMDIVRARQMRQDLDRMMLKMDKLFRYSRIKDYIK